MIEKNIMVLGADKSLENFLNSLPNYNIIYVSNIQNAMFEFIYHEFQFDEIIIFGKPLWLAERKMKVLTNYNIKFTLSELSNYRTFSKIHSLNRSDYA